MPIAQALLPEMDHEMATTRRLLERVPEDGADWRPHARSMTLGELAAHIANIPGYGAMVVGSEDVDLASAGAPQGFTTPAALLEQFDRNVEQTRAAVAAASDEALMEKWTMRNGDVVVMSLPRAAAIRTLFLNHLIHHRGQLSVYLRLRDVPLPSIYGPSADTQH